MDFLPIELVWTIFDYLENLELEQLNCDDFFKEKLVRYPYIQHDIYKVSDREIPKEFINLIQIWCFRTQVIKIPKELTKLINCDLLRV